MRTDDCSLLLVAIYEIPTAKGKNNEKMCIVVYFDQQMGASHVFTGLNHFFSFKTKFSIFFCHKQEKKKKKRKNNKEP